MKTLIMKWLNKESYLIKCQNQLLKESLSYLCYSLDAQISQGQGWSGGVSQALNEAKKLLLIVRQK